MKWTTEVPSEPGFYWVRWKGEDNPEIIEVMADGSICHLGDESSFAYQGHEYGNKIEPPSK